MKVHFTEEATVQAVHALFAKLATIRDLKPEDLLVPERRTTYEKTLEETYAVIVSLEKAFDHLANELEHHQARIDQADIRCTRTLLSPSLFMLDFPCSVPPLILLFQKIQV